MKLVQKYQTPAGTMRRRVPVTYEEIVDAAEKAKSKQRQKEYDSKVAQLNLDYELPNQAAENVQPKDATIYHIKTPEQQDDNPTIGYLHSTNPHAFDESNPYLSTAGKIAGAAPLIIAGGLAAAGAGQALAGSSVGGLLANGIRTGLQGLNTVFTPSTWLNPVTGKLLLSPTAGTAANAAIQGAISYQGLSGLWDQIQNGTLGSDLGNTVLNALAVLPLVRPLAYAGNLAKANIGAKAQPFLGFDENGLSIKYDPLFDAAFYDNARNVENLIGVKPRFADQQLFGYPIANSLSELQNAAQAELDQQLLNNLIDGQTYMANSMAIFSRDQATATRAAQSVFAKKLFGIPTGNSMAKGRLSEQDINWAMQEFGLREAAKSKNPEEFLARLQALLKGVPVMRPTMQEANYAGFTAGGAYIPFTTKVPNMDPKGLIWLSKGSKAHHEIRHFLDYMLGLSPKDREALRKVFGKFTQVDPDEWVTMLSDSRDAAYKGLSEAKGFDVTQLPLNVKNQMLSEIDLSQGSSDLSVEDALHYGSKEGKTVWESIEDWPNISDRKRDAMHENLYKALRSLWTKMGIGAIGILGTSQLNNTQDNETY